MRYMRIADRRPRSALSIGINLSEAGFISR